MDLMNKVGLIMAVCGMLTTVLGVILQILAMALEEILRSKQIDTTAMT